MRLFEVFIKNAYVIAIFRYKAIFNHFTAQKIETDNSGNRNAYIFV